MQPSEAGFHCFPLDLDIFHPAESSRTMEIQIVSYCFNILFIFLIWVQWHICKCMHIIAHLQKLPKHQLPLGSDGKAAITGASPLQRHLERNGNCFGLGGSSQLARHRLGPWGLGCNMVQPSMDHELPNLVMTNIAIEHGHL